jgi:ABC-2 type transport system permease protein
MPAPQSDPRQDTAPRQGQASQAQAQAPQGAGVPGEADQSRIHNIGYRPYEGPRLGRGYATRSLYTQSLRGAYGFGRATKSKVLPIVLFVVMCVPALIIVAVTVATKVKELPVEYTRYAVLLQAVIALYVAAQGPQAVSRDLRFRTMSLYFSRPIGHGDYVRAKYAALASALFILTAAPLVVLYVGALLAKLDFADQTKGFSQGLVSVALLSLLFAGIGLVISALTPRRGFGVAAVIAVLAISYGAVSTVQAIAFAHGNPAAVRWIGLFSPITLIDGMQSAFLGASSAFPGASGPSDTLGVVYLLVILAVIAGCYGILMRRYRKIGL